MAPLTLRSIRECVDLGHGHSTSLGLKHTHLSEEWLDLFVPGYKLLALILKIEVVLGPGTGLQPEPETTGAFLLVLFLGRVVCRRLAVGQEFARQPALLGP